MLFPVSVYKNFRMKRKYLLFFFILVNQYLLGCQCNETPTIEEAWKYSKQIFICSVIETNFPNFIYSNGGGFFCFFTIEIEEMFKGDLYKRRPEFIYDETGNFYLDWDTTGYYSKRTFLYRGSGSCDFWFEKGKRYLVYSYENGDFLRCSICSRTKEISDTFISELNELRELKKNEQKTSNIDILFDIETDKDAELNLLKAQLLNEEKENILIKYCIFISLSLFVLWKLIKYIIKKKTR